jgi:hypothetical protein
VAWRHGYVWLRIGRHDLAHAWWDQVDEPEIAARVHASRGSSLRELGLHDRAEDEDHAGLSVASSARDVAALRIGLVADAVGRAEAAEVGTRLRQARRAVAATVAGTGRDRQHIRLGWVQTEVALLTGVESPMPSLPDLGDGGAVRVPEHYRAGTVHHLAKGLLFAGVARPDVRALDAALALAPPGLVWAVHLALADIGRPGALAAARAASRRVVPPAHLLDEVAQSAAARRLAREGP